MDRPETDAAVVTRFGQSGTRYKRFVTSILGRLCVPCESMTDSKHGQLLSHTLSRLQSLGPVQSHDKNATQPQTRVGSAPPAALNLLSGGVQLGIAD